MIIGVTEILEDNNSVSLSKRYAYKALQAKKDFTNKN